MTALNKQALRQLAVKATKGEWRAFIGAGGTCSIHTASDERFGDVVDWPGFDGKKNAKANAKFIAAANPATVLALLDELEAAERRIAELEAKLANPVLLPKTNGYWNEQEKAFEDAITLAKQKVRLVGFRCEGDE
ncbi:MAG: ead/Ea22-like family protein [Hafnia sp.]